MVNAFGITKDGLANEILRPVRFWITLKWLGLIWFLNHPIVSFLQHCIFHENITIFFFHFLLVKLTKFRRLKELSEQLIHFMEWNGSPLHEAVQKMKIIEEYINQGIAAEICFSPAFAEATRKYFVRIHSFRSDEFLKKLKVLESILKW